MYASKDINYYKLETMPDGKIVQFDGDYNLDIAMSKPDVTEIHGSLKELEDEGYEIHRNMDGLSVGDVVTHNVNGLERTVIHRSGYGDLSLVGLADERERSMGIRTIKEIKEHYILKEPTPQVPKLVPLTEWPEIGARVVRIGGNYKGEIAECLGIGDGDERYYLREFVKKGCYWVCEPDYALFAALPPNCDVGSEVELADGSRVTLR